MKAFFQRPGSAFLLLFILTLCMRGSTFGQPLLHVDENFYLLVGDRWLNNGLWPYVDIWDRKPLGLFLIYVVIRSLGGNGFLQYQVMACAFVSATAWLVSRITARASDERAGWLAAIFYICWLPLYGGYGGQAPVFYNLFVTGAASFIVALLVDQPKPPADLRRLFSMGSFAMLLIGVAIQIKSSVIFEGIFLGCVLVWQLRWQRFSVLMGCAIGWIGIAFLPTFLALIVYWGRGDFAAYFFANVTSIFLREGGSAQSALLRLGTILGLGAPLLVGTLFALRGSKTVALIFLLGWTGAAFAAVLVFGTYYLHYGLALLPPLSITAAIGFTKMGLNRHWGAAFATILIVASTLHVRSKVLRHGGSSDLDAVIAFLPHEPEHCPYFTGNSGPALYLRTGACLPTKYVLSGHLFEGHEARAIGTNQQAELKRIIAMHPSLITLQEEPGTEESLATRASFIEAIRKRYRLAARRKIGETWLLVYISR